jgi:peptide/nickel transport system substrate-binding protein
MTHGWKVWARIGGAGLALALAASACGGSSNDNKNNSKQGSGKQGGTLHYLTIADFEHLDGGQIYVSNELNVAPLIYRTLTAYKHVSGEEGGKVVGDLAKEYSKSPDCTTWTFHIRDGLKYEDGTAIKPEDIKYAIERTFTDEIANGPTYAKDYIQGGDTYKGPYTDPTGDLSGIKISGNTMTFKLVKPVCDFDYTVAFPFTAPVPKAKDTKLDYDNHPVSSGPYKIQSYERDKQLVMVRNDQWKKDTDPVRPAYPDKVVFDVNLQTETLIQRLINDQGDDQFAVTDTSATAAEMPQIAGKPQVKSRLLNYGDGSAWYIGINTTKVTNLAVRKALNMMVDRDSAIASLGGPVAGDPANGFTAPNMPTYRKFDLYKPGKSGDVAKAKQTLQAAGVSMPVTLTFAYADNPLTKGIFEALQRGYEREGVFKINADPVQPKVYYTTVGKPATEPDLVFVGWGADWTSGSTVVPPLFDGKQIKPAGNQNYSQLNDPEINNKMYDIEKMTDNDKAQKAWADLEQEILKKDAPIVPIYYRKSRIMHGSKVSCVYNHPYYNAYDLSSCSVG